MVCYSQKVQEAHQPNLMKMMNHFPSVCTCHLLTFKSITCLWLCACGDGLGMDELFILSLIMFSQLCKLVGEAMMWNLKILFLLQMTVSSTFEKVLLRRSSHSLFQFLDRTAMINLQCRDLAEDSSRSGLTTVAHVYSSCMEDAEVLRTGLIHKLSVKQHVLEGDVNSTFIQCLQFH